MFSKAALRNWPLVLALHSSNISSLTSLTFANDPLFLRRFYQPTLVPLSHNPFRAQPVFHPCLSHASALRLLLRNAFASLSKLSSHSPCTLFSPVPLSQPCLLQSIMVCLLSLGFDPALDPTLCGLMDTCGALNTGYLLCSFIYG